MSTTTFPKKHIDELHFDHRIWTSNMKFFYDEVTIFENRLEELVQRNTRTEVTAQIEHFQNQFIRQKEVAQQIIGKCNDHEKFLANQAQEHPIAITRIDRFVLLSPEERYFNFLKEHPGLDQRIPQKHLASYLGITPVSLSRIRARTVRGN